MEQNLLLLCETVIIEQNTNKISLIGLFDSVNSISPGTPIIFPKFAVFSRFENGTGSHDHKIIITQEATKTKIAELPGKINFGQNGKAQYVGNFIGLPFPSAGKYKIEVYLDEDKTPQSIYTYLEVK